MKILVYIPFTLLLIAFQLLLNFKTVYSYYNFMPASIVLGQPNFTSSSQDQGAPNPTAGTLDNPRGITTDGKRLIVADSDNHRILIWNEIPKTSSVNANVVIGQSNFNTTNTASDNGYSLCNPSSVSTDGTRLFVADRCNSRALIFNSIPTSNLASADIAIGKSSLTNTTLGTTASITDLVEDIEFDPHTGKLVVTDLGNNRVLIYNSIPTTSGKAADVVVGQTNFTSSSTGTTSSKFDSPTRAKIINGKLLVLDESNRRVLVWNNIPTTNGTSADIVIGQENFTDTDFSPDANTLNSPEGIAWDGKRLFIADFSNRILIFDGIPTTNGAYANQVIGQTEPNNTDNQGTANNLLDMADLFGLFATEDKLFVSDSDNNRVLIFENTKSSPSLTLNKEIIPQKNGSFRFSGNSKTVLPHIIKSIEVSVNGSSFSRVSAKDGNFNTENEDYYFDLNPSDKKDLTLKIKAINSNSEFLDNLFYFEPFNPTFPKINDKINNNDLVFKFEVNKARFQNLKDSLTKYQIKIRKQNTKEWETLIDNIPVDFEKVKNSNDNLKKGSANTYETKDFTIIYKDNFSNIEIKPKNPKLKNGNYEWQATAIDKSSNDQQTQAISFSITTGKSEFSKTKEETNILEENTTKEETIIESVQEENQNKEVSICHKKLWFTCWDWLFRIFD